MRSDNVEVLMMSKRLLLLLAFFGSAFIAVADGATTAAVTASVSMESATGQDSPSDSTPGSEAPTAAAAAAADSSAGQQESTANSEAQITTEADSSTDHAETTEASHEATTTPDVPAPRHDGDDGAGEKHAEQTSDAGTSVDGAVSTMATREATGGQSTENGLVPQKEEHSTAPEKEVTAESETATSGIASQGDGAGQTGTEKVSDSGVQDATSGAKVAEETTGAPPEIDGDKSTTGSANDVAPKEELSGNGGATPRPTVLEAHRGLFITIGIMIAVCIVIGTLCLICIKCRGKSPADKQRITVEEGVPGPLDASSPIPDAEMVKDEAPMQELENPAVTPNGGGQHISKDDEDNGWVVPLDELSKTEKEKPETENTKL